MSANDMISRAQDNYMNVYTLQNVVLDRGDGCYLYDTDGKKYLDCAAGIAVVALGHNSPIFNKAITDQLSQLAMCTGSFVTKPKFDAAEFITKAAKMDRVFYCNSGTEAVEGALKTARLWAHHEKGADVKDVITFKNAFHGRTYGAVSVTEKARTYPEFGPYVPGVEFALFNDLESVKKLVTPKTCAIIVEPVQGEGGVLPATPEFMTGLRKLCDEKDICLIVDEVQTGIGRTGTFFAHEQYGIKPDIMTLAKGLGGGFPVGAYLAVEKFGKHIKPATHGSTYGGNPLACAVALAVSSEVHKPEFLKHVRDVGDHLIAGLEKLKRDTNSIEAIRGKGLMIGIDTVFDIKKLLPALLKAGMIATQAGDRSLRITPPLTLTKAQADEALQIIGDVIRKGDLA